MAFVPESEQKQRQRALDLQRKVDSSPLSQIITGISTGVTSGLNQAIDRKKLADKNQAALDLANAKLGADGGAGGKGASRLANRRRLAGVEIKKFIADGGKDLDGFARLLGQDAIDALADLRGGPSQSVQAPQVSPAGTVDAQGLPAQLDPEVTGTVAAPPPAVPGAVVPGAVAPAATGITGRRERAGLLPGVSADAQLARGRKDKVLTQHNKFVASTKQKTDRFIAGASRVRAAVKALQDFKGNNGKDDNFKFGKVSNAVEFFKKVGGRRGKLYQNFVSSTTLQLATIKHTFSGTAASDQETEFLKATTPIPGDTLSEIMGKLEAGEAYQKALLDAANAGFINPDLGASSEQVAAAIKGSGWKGKSSGGAGKESSSTQREQEVAEKKEQQIQNNILKATPDQQDALEWLKGNKGHPGEAGVRNRLRKEGLL